MVISSVNFVLCIIIFVLGHISHSRNKEAMHIGNAFGLFGLTYLIMLTGQGRNLDAVIIVLRILAYLLVILSLYRLAFKK